ncbi:endonuclease [Lacinutrix sp. Hel_I_90]|uniref:endonuclease n=1 Tax=Lacinutrix sp. Hel_I_90 TaxID=1249999 RepID=UPI00069661C8|nr:endonuclease [Lacinutrix sp. Hel_I_90]
MKQIYLILIFLFTTFSYAQLTPPAELQDYYNDVDFNSTGTILFNDLAVETASKHTNYISYTPGVWNASKITDEDPNNSSNVILIYGYDDTDGNYVTDRSRDKDLNGGTSGTDWNREHTFPNSLAQPSLNNNGTNVPPYADAHNLRPSDVTMNSNRGNRKFAAGSGNAGIVSGNWYPGDEWKGDAARIVMYMYLRYGTQCIPSYAAEGTTNSVDANMIELLLQWNAEDPVSDIEIKRNDYHVNTSNTYAQGNRNPFIDNPYIATVIWGGPSAQNRWSSLSVETFSKESVRVFPNPITSSMLTIETKMDTAYQIYDILGKLMLSGKVSKQKNKVNTENLNKGIYILKLKTASGSLSKKLIKH